MDTRESQTRVHETSRRPREQREDQVDGSTMKKSSPNPSHGINLSTREVPPAGIQVVARSEYRAERDDIQ